MKDRDRLINMAMEVTKEASDVIVRYRAGRTNQIRFSNSQIDIANHWASSGLEVFIALGKRIGSTEIENPGVDNVRARISELIAITKRMQESQLYSGISEAAYELKPTAHLYDPEIEGFPGTAPAMVRDVINAAEDQGARRVAGSLLFGSELIEIRTNHGAGGSYEQSSYELNARAFVDSESSGQGLACGRVVSRAHDRFVDAGVQAGRIAMLSRGGVQGKPGVYDLIMSPTVAANVLGQVAGGANPLMMMLGLSPLSDRLGQQLGPPSLNIMDDPMMEEGLGSRPFDDEGVPASRVNLFQAGRFVGVLHNTTSSIAANSKSTGSSRLVLVGGSLIPAPWPSNLVFSAGKANPDDMIQSCSKPTIYMTCNWYTRATNYAEGTFSTIPRDGTFLIEDGSITRPLRKIRISDNMVTLLSRIEELGCDTTQVHWWEVETPTFVPHIRFRDVNVTTATM